ncbi:hypothetical protein C1645_783497 [Glomus cerebriforme]|uniref:DNA polymerase kappa n=1 Tax=Glomus cerebriforme TaxID=658196 RepID=A0A397SFI1_9GLOM|nr:hypothetical protein C1645_783497 [Glomus cerebriforme]
MDRDEIFGLNPEDALGFLFANDNDAAKASASFSADGNNNINEVIQGGSKLEPEEKRVELITHKAGFDKVNQTKVNEILKKLEENSKFGRLKAKKDAELQENIQEQRRIFERLQAKDLTFVKSRVQNCIDRIEQKRDLSKYIVCVDMDAYYASIEERDNPALVNGPMGVGDSAMLCTANYTARKFGVRSGMPGYFAKVLCPQIVIVKPNFEKYTAVSRQIRTIFARYDPNFSAMSLDEAFLDLTSYVQNYDRTPEDVVQQIRNEIYDETKLTASAGIAANKLLAKVCADVKKPNGQFRLANDKNIIIEFLRDLPVRKICGIGQVAAKVLNGAFNIHTCGELLDKLVYINMLFSEHSFNFYMRAALGIGSSGISTNYTRKSISTSRTFAPTNDVKSFYKYLRHISEELAQRLDQENLEGQTIAVIFKMQTFEQFTRQKALTRYVSFQHDLYSYSKTILDKEVPTSLRLLGIRITNLRDKNISNVMSVKRYFAIKEDTIANKYVSPVWQEVDALNNALSSSYATNPVQDSLRNYEMLQLPSNSTSSQDDDIFPIPESQKTSLSSNIFAAKTRTPSRNRIDNGQSQDSTSILGDIANITLIKELSIPDDLENFSTKFERAGENVIESRIDSNTRKRALEDLEDVSKSSIISGSLALKRRLINSNQDPTQVNDNRSCVEDASATQEEGYPWNCPICNRHFDNPTRMRINSHLEACSAPRFPNTKISKVRGYGRGRGRGRRRDGPQYLPQPTLTLHNFFPSSHIRT